MADDEAVRHLIKLGYLDPEEDAARQRVAGQQCQREQAEAAELLKSGQTAAAIDVLRRLTRDHPDHLSPPRLLAWACYQAGKLDEARQAVDHLIHRGSESPELAFLSGSIDLAQRRFVAALEQLDYAYAMGENLGQAQTLMGEIHFRCGRLDQAEQIFRDVLDRSPGNAQALDGLAGVELRRGHFVQAADWALEALQQDMRLARAHYHLGVALAHLDRPTEAVQALETFARIAPTRAAPYRWLVHLAAEQLHDESAAAGYRDEARLRIRRRRAGR